MRRGSPLSSRRSRSGRTGQVSEDILLNGSDVPVDELGRWFQVYAVMNPS